MLKEIPNSLTIAEDADTYEMCVASVDCKEMKRFRLYKVAVTNEVFVLADDEEGAISQARCILRRNDAPDGVGKATVVPFGIRGWGKALF